MRDHRRLEAFSLADSLTLAVYQATKAFPAEERYGLSNQLRRSAVSVAANIVEGSARISEADYVRFLNMAYSSACELEYELSVASRLDYLKSNEARQLLENSSRTCKALRGLIGALS